MSIPRKEYYPALVVKSVVLLLSGTLFAIGNSVAMAAELSEDKPTTQNPTTVTQAATLPLLAQTVPIPVESVVQSSKSVSTELVQVAQADISQTVVPQPSLAADLAMEAGLMEAELDQQPDSSAEQSAEQTTDPIESENAAVAPMEATAPIDADSADAEASANGHSADIKNADSEIDTANSPANSRTVVQSLETETPISDSITDSAADSPSLSAVDLDVPARFGINASTATNGFGETIGVHGFVPLDQESGKNITFLEGNVQLNDSDPSFSLNVGHRGYDLEHNRIRGGYIGVDGRETGESTFFQLASGYERIDDDWEFRLNGYLPIGDRTNTIQNIDTDTGLQTSRSFQGNQLVLSAIRERQRILQQEDALGGFDAEIGTELAEWDGGELMGYAGGYLLSGEESSLGGQLRIAANFESNFNAGLSLQHDRLFGTTVALSVSATWPNFRFQDEDDNAFEEEFEVPIRLRDPIARRVNVAVNEISESEIINEEQTEPLRNPEEEEDYRFVHVALGGAVGDGTYESPFATVEDAIALINSDPDTYSDGNTIVYVDGENAASTIPGFTIPDRVRVLSQGPEQIIAGMEFSGFPAVATRLPFSAEQNFNVSADDPNASGITVSLPDSSDGVFPIITGGADDLVTLGNNTVLAGFQIEGATQHGITGSAIDNVELRNNLISNSGGSGIFLNNVGASAILFDNEINNSADRGIYIENTTTDRPIEVTIAGFELDNNTVGMDLSSIATSGSEFPSQIITVGPSSTANTSIGTPGGTALTNSILNSNAEGLVIRAEGDALTAASDQQLVVSEITIDGSGGDGVQIIADVGVHQQLVDIESSTITNSGIANNPIIISDGNGDPLTDSGGNGITIINGDTDINGGTTAATPDGASPQEIVILNSEISNNVLDGINITLLDAGAQELVIRGNQINNNGGDGIDSVAQTASVQEWRTDNETGALGISGNTITGNGGQAIIIDLGDVASLPILGIGNNDISGNAFMPDIEINTLNSLPAGSINACLVLEDSDVSVQVTAPDPFLSGNVPSVLVQDLPTLDADPNFVFLVDDFFLGLTESTAAYTNETNGCIQ